MRDLEHMKNPVKRMYDKFSNKFDEYIYDLVQQGHAYKIHGSIEESVTYPYVCEQVQSVQCDVVESENAILSLAKELEKTQRLINALEYVIMPNYEESMKLISAVLEEREREDFTRLKHVKKVLERKRLEE